MSVRDFALNGCQQCQQCITDLEVTANQIGDVVNRSAFMWKVMKDNNEHFRLEHDKKTHKKSKQFAFTFTTNQDTKLEIQKEMIESAWKLFNQKTVPVKEGEVYLEYTLEGRPHLHGWYETEDGGRIFAKIFNRVWPSWKEKKGFTRFPGGYHEVMKTNRYKGYAEAENRLVVSKKEGENAHYHVETAEKWHN